VQIKQTIKKLLPRNRFARSVSILAGGTAAAQGILVLSSPLLTRLYTPDDFGVLAVYASLLAIIGVIASLRYQLAIPLPEDDQEAAHVVVLSLVVVVGMALLSLVAVMLFRHQVAHLVNTPAMTFYLWLLPPGLLLLGTYQVFTYWAIRVKAFTTIARTKLAQSASMVAVQVGGFVLGPVALLLGHISGQAAGVGTLGALAIRNRWDFFRSVSLENIVQSAKRYRRFPIFSTWAGAFNSAGTHVPPLLFAALFSSAAAGLYILAHRVLSLPMTLVGSAVGQVFFSSAAEARRNGRLGELVSALHTRLAQVAMPPALFLFITGPDLFALVFGENWRMAGEAARWLSPMLYIQFIVSPLSQVFSILEHQVHGLVLQGILFITRIVTISLAWRLSGDFITAVLFYGLSSTLAYFCYLIFIVRVSGLKMFLFLEPSVKMLPYGVFLIFPLLISIILFVNSNSIFLISCIVSLSMIFCFYYSLFKIENEKYV
jgi:O-antigen/teichoic acid export membrane protein